MGMIEMCGGGDGGGGVGVGGGRGGRGGWMGMHDDMLTPTGYPPTPTQQPT